MKIKMQIKRFFALLLAMALVFSLSGCGNRNDEQPPEQDITEEDELVLYHNSTELAPMLMALAEEYSASSGKKISAKLAGSDFFGEMKNSGGAIYVVDTHSDISDFHSGGMFADFMNDTGLSDLFSGIPAGLQLNQNGIGSYGIPLMLEGYGFIFDKDMLSDLFGGENVENLIRDLKTCSFTEFEGFVAAVDSYIAAPSAVKVTVNGNEYTFAPEKTGKAANLTGVFSLNNESTRAMEHLFSTALAARFQSRYEVMTADEQAVSSLSGIVSAFTEAMDFMTGYISGAEGSISRGEEFTGGDYNYSTSIDLFTRGNALFYAGGTSDASDFEKSSAGFGRNLDILPMKLPITDEEITASGMTAEKLRSSIVIGSRYYIAINPNASETLSAAARDFVRWLYGEEAGKNAYSGTFGAVPHNFEYFADEKGEVGSSAEDENSMENTESEMLPSENENPSGIGDQSRAGIERKNSGSSADTSSGSENSSEAMPEIGMNATEMKPSHEIKDPLTASVAEYYAAGNWIPDMTFALPADFAEKVLGDSLSDYWGMEIWTDEDRKTFGETIIEGWKSRLDKDKTAVG